MRLAIFILAFALIHACEAASIVFIEPGTDATGDFAFYTSTSGTVASDATVSRTGPRSIKLSTGSPAVQARAQADTVLADAGRRISFWYRQSATTPAQANMLSIQDGSGLSVCVFNLLTNGTLRIAPSGATAADGTTVFAVNTWHRISIAYTITNTTTFKFVLWIDGILQATATAGTLTRTGSARLLLIASVSSGVNFDAWYDDIYVDNGSDYTDPDDVRVTRKAPAANNVNNYDTAVGNNPANRWENVNEVPISIANGWQQLAIADTQENYGLQGAATGDVDISAYPLLGRTAWIWAKETAVLGTPKIMDNGTETGITLTTSPALYTVTTTSASYPSNAAGIGMRSAATAAGTFLYECGTVIAYMAPHTRNGDFNTGF